MKRTLCKILFWIVVVGCQGSLGGWEIQVAKSPQEQEWGLMNRKTLGADEGMLFIYNPPEKVSFWMYNCYVDLSIAFLDQEGKLLKIDQLRAYPEKMRLKTPINSLDELKQHPISQEVYQFFVSRSVKSPGAVSYVLEMPKGWFAANGFREGMYFPLDKIDLMD